MSFGVHGALNSADSAPEPVVKTPEVMEKLEKFKVSGSGYNLSASSLSVYCGCPVQFYYKTVERRIRGIERERIIFMPHHSLGVKEIELQEET